ncbi:uncharacterized protein LOC113095174 [Carassius auratus]|uniref:Uncharacterized protein LOC113095174 n=1 Tax=Carassius auratus TaxID=7957 RepID=A0A6P6P6F7_CARAU|nr:uncharacterized protein LOC113095174 [Carassius auratus]
MGVFLTALTVLLVLPLKRLEAVELKEVRLGETVALMCNLSLYSETHWLRMSEGRLMALMVTSLKNTGELSVVWNYNETHFEGFMEKQMTGLKILHISTCDLATYYCSTSYQKRLDFDKGVQLYSKCDISFLILYIYICVCVCVCVCALFFIPKYISLLFESNINKWLSACLNGPSLHYQVFAAVLSFGLLGMLLAVSVVHMKTRTKNVKNDEK